MAIKKFKAMTPGQRYKTVLQADAITESSPYKPLTKGKRRTSGRNNTGQITVRHRGGGHKRKLRLIDFRRNKFDIPGKVETIERDPNRNALIALVCYRDGERRYIIAPNGLKVGDNIITSDKIEIEVGNASPIQNIPVGTNIHNIELQIGKGGQMARSAGTFATISGHDEEYSVIKLPSGEVRKVHGRCIATVGIVSNGEQELVSIGKAGRTRWMGRRPQVRGVAMNPVDHPLGGGEGRSSGGRHPVTPWGKPTRGKKTRNVRKTSEKFILSRKKGR